jgi:hypothetical protein
MRAKRRTQAAAVAALVTFAVAAPAAPAAVDEDSGLVLRRDGSKAVRVVTVPEHVARADGFDLGDAAIGAGATAASLLLAAAGARVARSRHTRRRPPLSVAGS